MPRALIPVSRTLATTVDLDSQSRRLQIFQINSRLPRMTPAEPQEYHTPVGHIGNLNQTQQSALDQLKKELKEQTETDFLLEGEEGYIETRMGDSALLR